MVEYSSMLGPVANVLQGINQNLMTVKNQVIKLTKLFKQHLMHSTLPKRKDFDKDSDDRFDNKKKKKLLSQFIIIIHQRAFFRKKS